MFGKPQNEKTYGPNDPESPLNQGGYVGVDPYFRTPGRPLAADATSESEEGEKDEKAEKPVAPSTPAPPAAPATPSK